MAVQNTHRSYIGVAKEATHGTAVAPSTYIPVAVSKLKVQDLIDPLFDEGLRGSVVKNFAYVQGRRRATVEFGGPVFADTFPWAVAALLGSVTTTGASAPFTHTVSLKNASTTGADVQPTSLTLTDFYAAQVRSYPGCRIHDLTLTFSAEGLLDYDAKGTSWGSATVSTPTPSFSTLTPVPTWQAQVTIGGSVVANSVSGEINLTRPVNPVYAIGTSSGSTQQPYSVFVGALETKGKFTFVMEDDTQLTNFLSNTQPAITVNWTNGSGATATQIQYTLTKGAYTVAQIERTKDFVQVMIEFEGLGNTTDAGATAGYNNIKWTFQNAVTSGTYQ